MLIMAIRFRIICFVSPCLAALYKERADDGGEHGDDELDDGFPSLQVFQEFHNC